jgi:hypothetical protein
MPHSVKKERGHGHQWKLGSMFVAQGGRPRNIFVMLVRIHDPEDTSRNDNTDDTHQCMLMTLQCCQRRRRHRRCILNLMLLSVFDFIIFGVVGPSSAFVSSISREVLEHVTLGNYRREILCYTWKHLTGLDTRVRCSGP